MEKRRYEMVPMDGLAKFINHKNRPPGPTPGPTVAD